MQKLLKKIIESKEPLVPFLFTDKQLTTIKKIYSGKKPTNSEKKAYYSSIKKKLSAIEDISGYKNENRIFISGREHIIPERIEKSIELINKFSKKSEKVFVAGSFLFSKEYNDIDVYIIRKKGYRELFENELHIIYLTEEKLKDPVFQSAAKISVSDFFILQEIKEKRLKLNEIMSLYHESIIEILEKSTKPEALRSLIFYYYLLAEKKLLNPVEIKDLMKTATPDYADEIIKKTLIGLFSKNYLYVDIHEYIKTLKGSILNVKPNEHLVRFKNTYEELIYGNSEREANTA